MLFLNPLYKKETSFDLQKKRCSVVFIDPSLNYEYCTDCKRKKDECSGFRTRQAI